MSLASPLERALERLRHELDDPFVEARVRRAEIDRKGRLMLDVDDDASWYRVDGDRVKHLEPFADAKLPLAERVRGSAAPRPDVLAWRPQRRLVIIGTVGDRSEVTKGFRRSRFEAAAARHAAAIELCSGEGGFRVPAMYEADVNACAFTMEALVGLPPRFSREHTEDFARIGHALARFQSGSTDLELALHRASDELAVLDGAHARSRTATGTEPTGWTAVRERLDAGLDADEATAVPCHRDLHDRQFLFGAGSPALIDFDSLCLADPALDPANLLAHLALRRLQGLAGADADGVRACGEALIDGMDRGRDRAFFSSLRFYQAASLLRLAAIYAMRPRWAPLSADLVRLAGRCCDDSPRLSRR